MDKPNKILVYTIFRNSEKYLNTYYNQVKNMVEFFSDIEFYFSAYENDSTDNTSEILKNLDWSFFKDFSIVTEKIKTKHFNSVRDEERVRNLSIARNKAIGAKDFLHKVDHVMMIESDMKYEIDTIYKLLNFYKKEEFDIVSGFTWHYYNNAKILYDTWATRTMKTKDYNAKNNGRPWFDLVENWRNLEYGLYHSTSNGVCLYKAKPFQTGIRYAYISPDSKVADCDTAVICEEFILSGYNKIFIIHDALIEHVIN